jgi:hypothetical protein
MTRKVTACERNERLLLLLYTDKLSLIVHTCPIPLYLSKRNRNPKENNEKYSIILLSYKGHVEQCSIPKNVVCSAVAVHRWTADDALCGLC